ncbi:MAG: type II secretion system protein [Patescibacteria group bacterium]|nr:type II secretion system protein [Patescibacteria group bacterium]
MIKRNKQNGFTLVEILAVMMVFGIIGGISAGILITTLRTSNKSNIITIVKQNGDYAISQITKTIRNSYTLKYPTLPCGSELSPTVSSYIQVVDDTGNLSTISCVGSNPPPAIPTIPPNTITLQQGSGSQTSLLDATKVQTQDCSFTCTQATTNDYPVIEIAFSLLQKSTSNFVEQIASSSAINFSTSVVFRNYQH